MTEINWFQSNKYYPSRKLGIYACISSRITTVIQVVRDYQINYNWYNEPFAVSQYKAFILRHAWLNLWDERMTTGRINQVAILKGFLQRSQWSDQKRKYMSFILLNFTYSITRIYCITNAAQSIHQTDLTYNRQQTCNKAQLSFQKPLFTYSGWSKHELALRGLFHLIKQFAHVHPICTVHKMNPRHFYLELTTWFLVRITKTISLLIK